MASTLTARAADVIKTCVRFGLGLGIVASMSYDEAADRSLSRSTALPSFRELVTWIGVRREHLLRGYMFRQVPH